MPVIQASHLTKEYRLGAMQGLKQTLLNTAARLTGKKVADISRAFARLAVKEGTLL